MNLTLFMQVLPKAGLGWLGVFAVTIIIVAAVELLVFNFNSFHLWMGDYTERRLSLTDVTIENGDFVYDAGQDQLTIRGKGEVLLTYQNLDQPVGTLTVDASLANHTKSASVIVEGYAPFPLYHLRAIRKGGRLPGEIHPAGG